MNKYQILYAIFAFTLGYSQVAAAENSRINDRQRIIANASYVLALGHAGSDFKLKTTDSNDEMILVSQEKQYSIKSTHDCVFEMRDEY